MKFQLPQGLWYKEEMDSFCILQLIFQRVLRNYNCLGCLLVRYSNYSLRLAQYFQAEV